MLAFLPIALKDSVGNAVKLPKLFKTIEKEFTAGSNNSIVEHTLCPECHTIYPSIQTLLSLLLRSYSPQSIH
jgi:hypothetical protein